MTLELHPGTWYLTPRRSVFYTWHTWSWLCFTFVWEVER